MSPSAIQRTASHIVAARRSGIAISTLDARPANLDEAFEVQARVTAILGETIGGWKAGFLDGACVYGTIYRSTMLESGMRYTPDVFTRGYEGELAFRFLRPLGPRATEYSRAEVMEAVAILPAIEIVSSRFAPTAFASPLDRAADNNVNGGFVSGASLEAWQGIDLAGLEVTFAVDGKTVFQATGKHPAGDPFAPALALANTMRARGGIETGQIVTTGAPTGCLPAPRGSEITVTFASIGTVTLTISA